MSFLITKGESLLQFYLDGINAKIDDIQLKETKL